MNLWRWFWGVVILFVGLVFLGINFNLLSPSIWGQIWKLWPVIIITIGVSIISGGVSRVWRVIMALVVATLILAGIFYIFGFSKIDSTSEKSRWSWDSGADLETYTISEPINEAADNASILIKTGAADLTVNGGSLSLVEGTVQSNLLTTDLTRKTEGKTDELQISSNSRKFPFVSARNIWDLKLSENFPIKLEFQTGAVDSRLDLRKTNVTELAVISGASSYEISFPEKPDFIKSEISVGASSVKLKILKDYGIRITADTGVTSNNFSDAELEKIDNIYKTKNFETQTKKIEIVLKTGASSIELEVY